jgi:phage tail sheath protein FI
VASVDANAKTVTLASPLAIAGMTGDVLVVAADPASRRAFARALEIDVLIRDGDLIKETFSGLTWNPDSSQPSYSRYYLTRINDKDTGSAFISLEPPATTGTGLENQPTTEDGYPLVLGGGDDGAPATAINLIGTDNGPGQRTGIEALRDQDDISLVAVPGVTDEAVQGALITHCELLKYRFAVLDGVVGVNDVSAIGRHRNNYDSKYAGYYVPWLETLNLETGNTLVVPPSGAVLGIYARSDNERGVHKAPANEVVRGITGLEIPFGTGEQDLLNPVGINAIREFVGRGIRVWGARTLTSDQEWKYINVRRLFIFMEKSIDRGTQWVVFEPNNEALWARVVETIEPFLIGVWKTGALMGTKPEEAFFVRCDRSTMTQDDIDNGRLVCLIGVAPTKPAEFVIFRIGQFTAKKS